MRTLDLSGVEKICSGKVREMFAVGADRLLMVATDRISAFDVILPNTVHHKGKILNQICGLLVRAHQRHRAQPSGVNRRGVVSSTTSTVRQLELQGRSSLVKRCEPLPIECVVRGYLAGSGWKDYQQTGRVCGIRLPDNLREADGLPSCIFTPATKAQTGHDINISFDEAAEIVGREVAQQVRRFSLKLYKWGSAYARERGIIICDTKFEFGRIGSRLYLIDEVLTPDSSRFWPADKYSPGKSQPSFDKQFIRDYLETLDWDKKAPGPALPAEIVEATSERYLQAFRMVTEREPQLD